MLVNIRFQVLFHSPPGVLFTFPSQYCSTIGHRVVFRLRGWSPYLPHGFHVSVRTPDTNCWILCRVQDSHPLRYTFPCISASSIFAYVCPYPFMYRYIKVWPPPLSLAATHRISFDFFSSAYLDVSLRRVPLITLFDSRNDPWLFTMVVSQFGNPRINAYLQLPVAYRS